MDDFEAKIAKLPAWAREYIKDLRSRPEAAVEAAATERKKAEKLAAINRLQRNQIEAMVEFFRCAAKGENEVAKAVQRIVEDFLVSDAE